MRTKCVLADNWKMQWNYMRVITNAKIWCQQMCYTAENLPVKIIMSSWISETVWATLVLLQRRSDTRASIRLIASAITLSEAVKNCTCIGIIIMVNASYLEAALKHKQAKNGSLGTELAEHKSIEAGCTKREMPAFDALNKSNMWGRKVTNLPTFYCEITSRQECSDPLPQGGQLIHETTRNFCGPKILRIYSDFCG